MSATILVVFALVLAIIAAGVPAAPIEPYRIRIFAAAFAFYMASLLPLFR